MAQAAGHAAAYSRAGQHLQAARAKTAQGLQLLQRTRLTGAVGMGRNARAPGRRAAGSVVLASRRRLRRVLPRYRMRTAGCADPNQSLAWCLLCVRVPIALRQTSAVTPWVQDISAMAAVRRANDVIRAAAEDVVTVGVQRQGVRRTRYLLDENSRTAKGVRTLLESAERTCVSFSPSAAGAAAGARDAAHQRRLRPGRAHGRLCPGPGPRAGWRADAGQGGLGSGSMF